MASVPQAVPIFAIPSLEKLTKGDIAHIRRLLTPSEESTWRDIRRSILNSGGEISVPELAHLAGRTERAIYHRLRGIKAKGLIYSITPPGKTSKYYVTGGAL